jgi:murein DD-endopeptidase MepM/ murein hydrolase activator NlpD
LRKSVRNERSHGGALRLTLALAAVVVLAWAVWGAMRRGPAPAITITTSTPAIGKSTTLTVHFAEPVRGLAGVRVELIQGDRTDVLGEQHFARAGAFNPFRGHPTPEATVDAVVGRDAQEWLREGKATVRATADRMAGPLRSHAPEVVEKTFAVRLRPPRLEILSQQHYVRQGGSGMVRLRVGESAVRSGVRAGSFESLSYPLPGGSAGERFVLYAVPWQLSDGNQIRAFAEDDAGNRVELPFVTIFKDSPPTADTIHLTDGFLQRVVPAIEAETPGLDTSGSLIDQYVRINRDLRETDLARVAAFARGSEPRFLWSGAFLQMPDTAKRANFAENRTYVYEDRVVDHETHLGLDLASHANAPVPAPNSGKVIFAGWFGIYGNAVILDHGYGLMSLCGHMSSVAVKPGEMVSKGQLIGHSGATGLAGGDHLHLEIFIQGESVNPLEWLDAHWIHDNLATKVPVPGV